MRVLVACEESQRVCTAFRDRGHEAYSCDVLECSGGHKEWHIGFSPYVMIYDKDKTKRGSDIRLMQRWVNAPQIFNSVKLFEDYKRNISRGE